MTSAELDPELRNLVDARLEAIDGMLTHAAIGWSERRSIVGEVETQIFELLERGGQPATADGVQAVLDMLDPPEAYIPEELRNRLSPPEAAYTRRQSSVWSMTQKTLRTGMQLVTIASCVGAVIAVNCIVILLVDLSRGIVPWMVTIAVLAWSNYACVRWFRAWSATRHGRLMDDIRQSLGDWLLSKNGAHAT